MKIEYETLSPDNECEVYDLVTSAVDDNCNLENKLVLGYKVKRIKGLSKAVVKALIETKLSSILNPEDLEVKVLSSGYDKEILDKDYYYIGVQLTTYEVPL